MILYMNKAQALIVQHGELNIFTNRTDMIGIYALQKAEGFRETRVVARTANF